MTINTRFLTSFLWLRPKKLVRNDKITLYQLPVDTVFENDGVLARRVPGTSPPATLNQERVTMHRCHTKDDVTVNRRAVLCYIIIRIVT